MCVFAEIETEILEYTDMVSLVGWRKMAMAYYITHKTNQMHPNIKHIIND